MNYYLLTLGRKEKICGDQARLLFQLLLLHLGTGTYPYQVISGVARIIRA